MPRLRIATEEPPARALGDGLVADHRTISAEPLPPYEVQAADGTAARVGDEEEMYTALVVGLRGYIVKNGFRGVLIGLSGGIDSALVAAIACDAVGAANVHGVAMPSRYSSEHRSPTRRNWPGGPG